MAGLTFAGVRIDSLMFWPVREVSYLYVTTSMPFAGVGAVTVNLAALLVTTPDELETATENIAPSSPVMAAGIVYEAAVAPVIAVPFRRH